MSDRIDRTQRAQMLVMGKVDGELSPEEENELAAILEADDEINSELRRMEKIKTVTGAVTLKPPPDQIWEDYMNSVYQKVERGVGWILLSLGAIVILSYGFWNGIKGLIETSAVPLFLKGAILAALVGAAVITVSVVREKVFMKTKDPYREIQR